MEDKVKIMWLEKAAELQNDTIEDMTLRLKGQMQRIESLEQLVFNIIKTNNLELSELKLVKE